MGIKRERDLEKELKDLTQENKALRRKLKQLQKYADNDESYDFEDFNPDLKLAPIKSKHQLNDTSANSNHQLNAKIDPNRCKCGGEIRAITITPKHKFNICQKCKLRTKID